MDKKQLFVKVVKEHQGLILKVAALYTNSSHDREDLSQEIVYQLWRSFDSFSGQAKISTWMYRISLNTAIKHLKQHKKAIATVPMDIETLSVPDRSEKDEQLIKTLYDNIRLLNLLEKGIIMLYLDGKSHEEIAAIIGLSITNVGTKISRIREKLKAHIKHK